MEAAPDALEGEGVTCCGLLRVSAGEGVAIASWALLAAKALRSKSDFGSSVAVERSVVGVREDCEADREAEDDER